MTIGWHRDICGEDAELAEFTPTRAELKTLAYHYLDRYFRVMKTYAEGISGSYEIREAPFAWRRFESIADCLKPDGLIEEFVSYISKKEEVDKVREAWDAYVDTIEEERIQWMERRDELRNHEDECRGEIIEYIDQVRWEWEAHEDEARDDDLAGGTPPGADEGGGPRAESTW